MYSVVYLPSVRGDIQSIMAYIADELKAPLSANNFLDVLESSISNLQEFPYAYPIYQPLKSMDNEYRVLPVKNYLVFYIVREADKKVEIRRVLYAKMNTTQKIKDEKIIEKSI